MKNHVILVDDNNAEGIRIQVNAARIREVQSLGAIDRTSHAMDIEYEDSARAIASFLTGCIPAGVFEKVCNRLTRYQEYCSSERYAALDRLCEENREAFLQRSVHRCEICGGRTDNGTHDEGCPSEQFEYDYEKHYFGMQE